MNHYIKFCQESHNKLKTDGIAIINTESGEVEYEEGFSEVTQNILEIAMKSEKLNALNSQFNSIFYKRGFPSLIRIKHSEHSEFIKFLDIEHVLYFVQQNNTINYPKIKIQLSTTITAD